MKVRLNVEGWTVQPATRVRAANAAARTVPDQFLSEAKTTDEFFVSPAPAVRGAGRASGILDITCELNRSETAVLALRHPSGALTFHGPRATSETRGGPVAVRFVATIRFDGESPDETASRGHVSTVVRVVVIKFADVTAGVAAKWLLPRLALAFETATWNRKGLKEGWLKVTKDGLAAGRLDPGKPTSTERSLLFIHGTLSNAASAFGALATSSFFEDVGAMYGDRIFAFDHFTISRTPEENARALLRELPNKSFAFDVITHSRGGLVLRMLAERSSSFAALAHRFTLDRAVLVATPNEGTPLATPSRWEETVGWIANLLELFPENPFTTGPEFVAHGLKWLARHALGNLPGLHSMDADGDLIRDLQSTPGPAAGRYSVLAANYHPTRHVLRRLLDIGIDQFFNTANDLVVPSEGGWRVDPSDNASIAGARIGCFGPGGNIDRADVTHVNLFEQPETVAFLVTALNDRAQELVPIDPAQRLPDHRVLRATPSVASATQEPIDVPAAARLPRVGSTTKSAGKQETRIGITVVNGNLTFEQLPMLIGHYRANKLTGTEAVIDELLGGAMSSALHLGVYPSDPGSHRIFNNRRVAPGKFWQTPRPEAVIVAGLGQEARLQSMSLIHTVRQAVLAWCERAAERGRHVATLRLGSTLLASGGVGVSPGQAAQLIAQGVFEANELIRRGLPRRRLPYVAELRFIELYLSRATEAWEALRMQADATPNRYLVAEPITSGLGWLLRPLDSGYRGADYDFITAETRRDSNGNISIAYALDTKRARTEIRAQATQARLLRDLVATASTEPQDHSQIGRTLYNLLVPVELEAFLVGAGETQIEVDEGTAGIPWEMLDDSAPIHSARLPWAIRSKLLRKFRTEKFRLQVMDADTDASILLIGEPKAPPDYAALPGALQEAKDIHRLLTSRGLEGDCVQGLFAGGRVHDSPEARQVIEALFERSWRIVHIAGHGEPVDGKKHRGGVVLSNETFIGATEIKAMRVVPELVFVNCCHLSAGPQSILRPPYDRAAFAASVAKALIEIGVRCVVAAGWAVEDSAASAFATTFYEALLRGQRFIDAVAEARTRAYEFEGNTWAAYQCYGDPDWTFIRSHRSSRSDSGSIEEEFDHIVSIPALELALDTLLVQSTYQGYESGFQLARVRKLEERYRAMRWNAFPSLSERFAQVFAASNDLTNAIRWYESAVAQVEGPLSFRILEQLGNLRIRQAFQDVKEAEVGRASGDSSQRTGKRLRRRSRGGGHLRARAQKQLDSACATARIVIRTEMKVLAQMNAFGRTAERESLRGAAMKRLAMVEMIAGRTTPALTAIRAMSRAYRDAAEISGKQGIPDSYYSSSNVIAAELALNGGTSKLKPAVTNLFDDAERAIKERNLSNPDFWSLVAEPELRLYRAIVDQDLPTQLNAIERAFRDVHKRSQSAFQWKSVADNAHFILDSYLARAPVRAAAAARQLLRLIDQFAGVEPKRS